jgi:acid phosphatase family membrane protein YuiD
LLNETSNLLERQNQSLGELSKEIKQMESKHKKELRQHTFWGVVGGIAIGFVAGSVLG